MPSRCRSCKAAVRWSVTEAGEFMALDAVPNPEGEWRLAAALHRGGTPRAVYVPETRRDELRQELMIVHWATCPYADKHRKRRAR